MDASPPPRRRLAAAGPPLWGFSSRVSGNTPPQPRAPTGNRRSSGRGPPAPPPPPPPTRRPPRGPHARPYHRLGGSPYWDSRQGLVQRRLALHMVEPYRVAQRDQFRRALRRHRTCDLAHRENVALDHRLLRHEAVGFGRHPDRALRRRRADRDGLVGDVHHPSPARRVEVRQLHRGDPRSSPSTAATSCGFTLPCASSRASSTRAMADTTFPESFPARASLRNRASSSSSIAVNAPRA